MTALGYVSIQRPRPRGWVTVGPAGYTYRTRGGLLMDAIWRRGTSQTLRGALMLDAAWRLHRARYADTRAVAAYELERAADARRELVRLDHEVFVTDPEDGTSYCDCGAVMARNYGYAVGTWHAHLREVGAE